MLSIVKKKFRVNCWSTCPGCESRGSHVGTTLKRDKGSRLAAALKSTIISRRQQSTDIWPLFHRETSSQCNVQRISSWNRLVGKWSLPDSYLVTMSLVSRWFGALNSSWNFYHRGELSGRTLVSCTVVCSVQFNGIIHRTGWTLRDCKLVATNSNRKFLDQFA